MNKSGFLKGWFWKIHKEDLEAKGTRMASVSFHFLLRWLPPVVDKVLAENHFFHKVSGLCLQFSYENRVLKQWFCIGGIYMEKNKVLKPLFFIVIFEEGP